jgi:transmembrane sensor
VVGVHKNMDSTPRFIHDPEFEQLLVLYYAGQCPDNDRARIEQMLAEYPAERQVINVLVGQSSGKEPSPAALSAAFEELLARVRADEALGHVRQDSGRRAPGVGRGRARILRGVSWRGHRRVSLFVMATLGVAALIIPVIRAPGGARRNNDDSHLHTYETAAGQQAVVTLRNGSRAILGPATTISELAPGTDGGMTVRLTGQAVFSLVHRSSRPFTVRTGNTVTQVLGTTFLVRQYPGDTKARVVVTEGRVSLRATHGDTTSRVVLIPRMLATADDSGKVNVTPEVAIDDYTAWIGGRLVFRKTRIEEIIADLGRAYGAEIRLADSTLATQTLTWTVSPKRITLDEALDGLATAVSAHVVKAGRIITIVPGVRATPQSRNSHPLITRETETQYGR